MLMWLQGNAATILISLLLIALVAVIIRRMILDKRAGRSTCGGNCAGCHGCRQCSGKS